VSRTRPFRARDLLIENFCWEFQLFVMQYTRPNRSWLVSSFGHSGLSLTRALQEDPREFVPRWFRATFSTLRSSFCQIQQAPLRDTRPNRGGSRRGKSTETGRSSQQITSKSPWAFCEPPLLAKAFGASSVDASITDKDNNPLRATVVLGHVMQASDVVHTIRHWRVF